MVQWLYNKNKKGSDLKMSNKFYGREISYSGDVLEFIQNQQQIESGIDEDETESCEDLQSLYNILEFSCMSEKQYIAMKLSQWKLTHVEIAELLSTTPNAVGLLVHKGRKKKLKINKLLEEYLDAEEKIQNAKVKFYNRKLKSDMED